LYFDDFLWHVSLIVHPKRFKLRYTKILWKQKTSDFNKMLCTVYATSKIRLKYVYENQWLSIE